MISIIINSGKSIAAAFIGLITKDITGTANIAIGPGNPPFDIPKTITPKEASKKNVKSTTTLKL
tara:strand:- start:728 stop:919 length:192 start_codon:yes stop_codon:yes gene_type:complete